MPEIDNEIQHTVDALRAVKQIPRGETMEQTGKRIAQTFVLRQKLDELRYEKAQEYRRRSEEQQIINQITEKQPGALDEKQIGTMVPIKTERRAFAAELRARGRKLEGYAAVFNSETRIADFVETIRAGAFASSLADKKDILALVDHDTSKVLARTKSGTLRLSEDSRGLAFSLDVPPTQAGNDALALAERGDIGGASFAFTVRDEHWDGDRRELRAVDLHEVSIVSAWPAYPNTEVLARARPGDCQIAPRLAVARRFLESL